MDMSTVLGLAVMNGLILTAILMGGMGLGPYIDVPSVVIVCGGTLGAVVAAFPFGEIKEAMKAGKLTLKPVQTDPSGTVKLLEELSQRARREGLLSLEEAAESAEDEFLKSGLRMMVDGHEPSAIESVLYGEIDKLDERHKVAIAVYDAVAAYAPGMGLIGTLIGLVQMLQNMSDPTAIGPAMAVALLTTFYGAILANVFGTPLANKLKQRNAEELAQRELVAQGLMSILGGENPRFMVDRLNSTLPPAIRVSEEAA
jgi:chemotaxis protein MotA